MVSSDVGGSGTPNIYILNQETGDVRYFVGYKERVIELKD